MNRIKFFTVLLLLAAFNVNVTAQNAGDNDPTFNPNDSIVIGFLSGIGINNSVSTTNIQPDGKIIIGGSFTSYNGTPINRIARLNTDGSLDTTFDVGTGVNNAVMATVLQVDGKIIIGGVFTSYNGTPRNKIARLNTDGSLDTSFAVGAGANDLIWTALLQPDGTIIIGGNFTEYNGTLINYLARLNTDGSIDSAFNIGTGASATVRSTTIQSDGKIIIGGSFISYNGIPINCIARLNTNGSLDTSFAIGTGASSSVWTTAIQSDGKIIIGGLFTSYNGTARGRIARLNSNGSLDTSFATGIGASGSVSNTSLQSDGKIIIGGGFTSYNGIARARIARLNSNGSLDTSFSIGTGASTNVTSTTIQPDGKIIIGGNFTSFNGTSTIKYLVRLNSNGSLDHSSTGKGANNWVFHANIQPDKKIIIGGAFTDYSGTPINRVARINTDGNLDTSFTVGNGADGFIRTTAIQSDGKIIIGGDFTNYNGTLRNRIARIHSNGSLDTSFNFVGGITNLFTTSIQPDGKITIGGNFSIFNGPSLINHIVRLNTNGSIDTTFSVGTGANHYVLTTTIQVDGKIIIGGGFTSYNGAPINQRIARLNIDGSIDTTFSVGTGANNWVWTTLLQPDGKIIIGGNFTEYNGTLINRIARLNTDGSLDTSFLVGTGVDSSVVSATIQPDGKIIIGGAFTSYNGTPINRIARLNTDGSLDTSFTVGTGANSSIWATPIQSDGKIIIGGEFTSYNGIRRNRIARVFSNCTRFGTDIQTVCDSITWINGITYTTSTNSPTFTILGGATNGCDSLVTLNLTILRPTTIDTQIACNSFTWIDNITYTTSTNTPTFTIPNGAANGCDSIVTLNLTINPVSGTDVQAACNSFTWIDNITYTTSTNTPTFTIPNGATNGCDSIVTLNLTISTNIATGTDVQTACNSFTWIDNVIYTSSTNTPTFTLIGGASNGCDSIVTLNLTINNPVSGTDVQVACNSFTWIDNVTYTSSTNTPTFTIPNGATNGCDSIVTLNLILNNTATGTDVQIACNSFTWIDNITYTSSTNTPNFTIPNGATNGCDSIVTLNLTISTNIATGTDVQIVCINLTWIDGNTYTSSTNSQTFTIANGAVNGCDSIVTLNLTINGTITITDINGEAAGDASGLVSMPDANTVAIGSPFNDGNGTYAGHVRIFSWNGSGWIQKGLDIDGVTGFDLYGRAINMPDANTIAISALFHSLSTTTAGRVDVYTWNGSAWIQKGLSINGEGSFDQSGFLVNMPDANTLAISSLFNSDNGSEAGHVRIFTWNGTAWIQKGLDIDGEAAGDWSGYSISMPDANTVAIGAIGNDGNGTNAGHVRIYSWNGMAWTQKGVDIDGVTAGDSLGVSVSMPDANTVGIGAPANDGNGINAGHVRIFSWNGSNWIQKGIDMDGDVVGDRSGSSVSMPDANTVGIGAPFNDGNGTNAGNVKIHRFSFEIGIDVITSCTPITWIDGNTYTSSTNTPTFTIINGATNGCDSVVTLNLTLTNLTASYTKVDNGGGNYTFTNTSTGNVTQTHWAFGDGTTSTLANPTHTFNANGTFVVVLTIKDSTTNNTCMDYYLDTLVVTGVVNPVPCAAGFVMYPDGNNNVTVVNSSTGNNLSYFWDFGDGDTSTMQFPSHTYATAGPFYLCLTVNDGASCVDTYCDSIGINGVVFNKQTGFTINVIAPPVVVGVDEQGALITDVTIYPNPTKDEFVVELTNFSPSTQINIISIEGKTVYSKPAINTNKLTIDASEWSRGIYVVKITDKQSSKVVKLIKQ